MILSESDFLNVSNVSYDLLKITSETKEPSNTKKNYERASLNEAV